MLFSLFCFCVTFYQLSNGILPDGILAYQCNLCKQPKKVLWIVCIISYKNLKYIDSHQPPPKMIFCIIFVPHTVKIHLCAIHPFFSLMYSSIWSIAMNRCIFLCKISQHYNGPAQQENWDTCDISAWIILGPMRQATYLINFYATCCRRTKSLWRFSQLLSDTRRKISWKIVVVGSCYRWFRRNLCFSETYFPPTRLVCQFIREFAKDINILILCLTFFNNIQKIWHFMVFKNILVYMFSNVLKIMTFTKSPIHSRRCNMQHWCGKNTNIGSMIIWKVHWIAFGPDLHDACPK